MGGAGISGGVTLRNDDKTHIELDDDPWKYRWEQESFIYEEWQYRKSMMSRVDLLDQPQWLKQGIEHLNHLEYISKDG